MERTGHAALHADASDRFAGTAPTPGLYVQRLHLTAFRNYAHAALETDGRPVVLTGPNGAGKTNLLEAVSFLAPGRGLRRAGLSEVERHPGAQATRGSAGSRDDAASPSPTGPAWAVAARVMTPEGSRDLGTGRDPSAEGRERRVVKIDGDFAGNQQMLGELVAVTWLTPQMDRLFQDSPGGRRRFIDRLVYGIDPAHAGRVNAYEHAMRERARLLRGDRTPDPDWLGVLEQRMAERGVAIAAARRQLVDRLASASASGDGPFPKAGLGLSGDLETWFDELSALDAEEKMASALAQARGRDAETGGAAYGPHRADLMARHVARDLPAELCSTGEQKALLISIVLAHARLLAAERGFAPLVLLDEVAAHLDAERRAALFDELVALGAQPWLTGTDPELFAGLHGRAQFFEVRAATIAPAT
ncbi:DNA replication/repair protein RecF [Rhodovibrio salinarum]|uniref:DNA replication and repair protein RecF n=1 Tax=Rhodovibrio salinarum TaxID=1087 RepID=A0A934QHQ6_9PROT|nr:DNA replication/repair protein RecF [Rhodovibrio salinarum]MBK1696993.1 DNA replication/repair protein RecF [Rhodovibrio salinarum]